MQRNKKITFLMQAESPLTQMMGNSGNESLINREPVLTELGKRFVPVLSANSIRHSLIRESGVDRMLKLCHIDKLENVDQLNFLYTGGSLTQSATTESVDKIKRIYETMPIIKLLGGSLRNQILNGMLLVGRGMLVCEENRSRLAHFLPKGYSLPDRLMSAEIFIGNYQYTRGDVEIQKPDKIKLPETFIPEEEDKKKKKSNLMIYNGQTIIPGAMFIVEFILQNVNDIDIGAFFSAIKNWQNTSNKIGGYSRIGHGRMSINILDEMGVDKYVEDYENFIKEQPIEDFLNFLFPKETKEKKKK